MRTLWWDDGRLVTYDQTKLPEKEKVISLKDYTEVAEAIGRLRVRGAPAIGIAAAFGLALAARKSKAKTLIDLQSDLKKAADTLRQTRPTAVNLAWALDRTLKAASFALNIDEAKSLLLREAERIDDENEEMCRAIGRHGAALIPDGARILTHCNAGALATAAYGTALGVIRAAHEAGKNVQVYVDETRPLLQGARLTAYELGRDGIPYTLITDNMAGYAMKLGRIDLAIVGADRIARNGDTANKIGTYSVAILCREHGLPFYVAAPSSTFDLSLESGDTIPIEERCPEELIFFGKKQIAPKDARVFNPAFDVTPARYIKSIITESGVIDPPYFENIPNLVNIPKLVSSDNRATPS